MVDVSDKLAWIRDGTIERVEERSAVSLLAEEL